MDVRDMKRETFALGLLVEELSGRLKRLLSGLAALEMRQPTPSSGAEAQESSRLLDVQLAAQDVRIAEMQEEIPEVTKRLADLEPSSRVRYPLSATGIREAMASIESSDAEETASSPPKATFTDLKRQVDWLQFLTAGRFLRLGGHQEATDEYLRNVEGRLATLEAKSLEPFERLGPTMEPPMSKAPSDAEPCPTCGNPQAAGHCPICHPGVQEPESPQGSTDPATPSSLPSGQPTMTLSVERKCACVLPSLKTPKLIWLDTTVDHTMLTELLCPNCGVLWAYVQIHVQAAPQSETVEASEWT